MDYKDKQVIIGRFNDAIKYIASMQKAIFNENRSSEIEQKRNAGYALIDAYEWSVKYHLYTYASSISLHDKSNNFFGCDWKNYMLAKWESFNY